MPDFGSALWNKPASGGGGGDSTPADPVTRSLRWDDGNNSYLYRATGSTDTTWTVSMWVKRCKLGDAQYFFSWGGDGISFDDDDKLSLWDGSAPYNESSAVFRDTASWYNICISCNSGSITVYVNGVAQTLSRSDTYAAWGNVYFGIWSGNYSYNFDGYLADIYGIEGSALDHTSFTESNGYGGLKPKAYTGSFGTNGFHLKLDDSSDIGADDAGSNDYTATNFSSHDVMLDVPTKNYCTLSPFGSIEELNSSYGDLHNANLTIQAKSFSYYQHVGALGTFGLTSGKWYFEVMRKNVSGAKRSGVGLSGEYKSSDTASAPAYMFRYYSSGRLCNGSTTSELGAGIGTANYSIYAVAVDVDAGKIWFSEDGSWIDDTSGNTGDPANGSNPTITYNTTTYPTVYPIAQGTSFANTVDQIANFGQDPTFGGEASNRSDSQDTSQGEFYFAPPTGFKSLNSSNLDAPSVTPTNHFDVLTYNGAYDNYSNFSGTSPQTVTGTDFTPEIVWIKDRDNVSSNYGNGYHGGYWFDNVMGTGYALNTDLDNSSHSGSSLASGEDGISSFNSNGFTVDEADETNAAADSSYGGSIDTYERYVAWCWKLGSSGSSSTWASGNTDPDTEKYNASAGVSIIDYYDSEYGGSAITLNHSLGAAPEFAIAFDYEGYTSGHYVWHKDLSSGNYLILSSNSSQASDTDYFPASPATATTFTLGTSISSGTQSHVALFSGVEGYSKFGTYEGNGSTDGCFVYTGFRPEFLMVKRIGHSDSPWKIRDAARDPHNVATKNLDANSSGSEGDYASNSIDLLSNGFKWRTTGSHENHNGHDYIYACFAEQPFSAPSNAR